VGTWKGEFGNVLNFRPDGTARSRWESREKIAYFEWTFNSGDLATYQYASKRSLPAWFGRAVLNYRPTDRKKVAGITATQFQLRDTTGKTLWFTRTQDTALESAP